MLRVLVVDDTKSVHAFIRSMLARLIGVEVTAAFDGQQAVELLSTGACFDLILLDWEMPRLDGPGAYAEFKRLGVKTPVIMVTTKNQPAEIAAMLDAGVAEYMMKPFTLDILVEKIAAATGVEVHHAA